MGWQEQQAAARAREQQRQAEQNRMSAQRAESIRQENAAKSRAQRERTQAEFAATNAENDKRRKDADRQASQSAHDRFMKEQAQIGRKLQDARTNSYTPQQTIASSPSVKANGKSKGGSGWFLVLVAIIAFFVYAGSHPSSGGRTGQEQGSATTPAATDTRPDPVVAGPVSTPQPQPDAGTQSADSPATGPNPDSQITELPTPSPVETGQGTEPAPSSSPAPVPVEAPAPDLPQPVSSTGLQVTRRISPRYPLAARQSGVSGTVLVVVSVNSDGAVVNAVARNGDPMLIQAATDAAREWQFAPYTPASDGMPRTTSINFHFGDR